ncbi:MAG: GDP-mannose 4,6-dehydratase [Thermoguttaceae bacterium]|nr:GDP-mannose 4,6-dehydratase [Thermoguttaceae bacterium]MDW8039767.1 GDP-mannose 4,6-dehydratase [Thermoguttaceae bacterium]
MRYLVTGCAGFIGWKVAELLLRCGAEVVGLDDLNPAYDIRLKRWRLDRLLACPGFRFFQIDITQAEAVEKLFSAWLGPKKPLGHALALQPADSPEGKFVSQRGQTCLDSGSKPGGPTEHCSGLPSSFDSSANESGSTPPFDAVVHLAARAGVRASLLEPEIYFRTNTLGTLVLLEACRRYGVPKFLLASTSALYGRDNPIPYREDADTSRPLSPYAASKKAAECAAYTYHYLYDLDVVVLRYFTVYGPAGRPDMSVFRFVRQITEGEPVTIYGDGNQRRDFTYVEDVARGTLAALQLKGFEIINLGSDRPVSIQQLIERIEQLVGKPARLQYRPVHPADVPATWADIRRAKEKLGWSPQTSLEEGLAQTVAWYQEHRNWAAQIHLSQ